MAPFYASLVTCIFFGSSSASQFRMCSARNYLFFSHRAILYVMFTCNCVFIAALILFLLNVFSFNSDRICFRCSRGLVSFCCLFSSSQVYWGKSNSLIVIMPHSFSCVTVNTRGLNNARKRRQVFRWLYIDKFQVIFLQEIYCSSEIEKLWSAEWGVKMFFCRGSKHSKGTVIMFNPSLDAEIIECAMSQKLYY